RPTRPRRKAGAWERPSSLAANTTSPATSGCTKSSRASGLRREVRPLNSEKELQLSLTAPERETVITCSDESDTGTIHTHQRGIITKLRNNPAAGLCHG